MGKTRTFEEELKQLEAEVSLMEEGNSLCWKAIASQQLFSLPRRCQFSLSLNNRFFWWA